MHTAATASPADEYFSRALAFALRVLFSLQYIIILMVEPVTDTTGCTQRRWHLCAMVWFGGALVAPVRASSRPNAGGENNVYDFLLEALIVVHELGRALSTGACGYNRPF